MRGRAVGLGLLGLGAFLLAGALAVRLLLEPGLVKLPLDQKADPVAIGSNVDFFDLEQQEQLTGIDATVTQHVQGDVEADEAGEDLAVWTFGSTVADEDGDLLNASTYRVCIDRRTAEAQDCESTHVDYDRDATITGLTLTFPFGTEKRDYDVFNSTVRAAFPARFEDVEQLEGLEVYRFQMSVPETVVRSTEVPGAMAGSPDVATVTADAVYSNERTFWVEPTSGVIVTAEEHPDTFLRGPDGTRGVTLLSGDFAADEDTLAAGVKRAEDTMDKISMVKNTVPLIMVVLGALLLVAGALLLMRRRPAGAHREDEFSAEDDARRVPAVQ